MSPADFQPAWWCRGQHVQTIWGALFRPLRRLSLIRERWETPDGDFVDVDRSEEISTEPRMLILHGLEGSSQSREIRGLIGVAQQADWEAVALNFRSCSGEPNRLQASYHAGHTTDIKWVIERLVAEDAERPIVCVGVSLGGNILLKYLGEQGDQLPDQVRAAVAISTPFDLSVAVKYMESGFRQLYMRMFVWKLKQKVYAKLRHYPEMVDRGDLRAVRTIADFDHLITAPLNGFKDGHEYWSACSSATFLSSIRRPTLLLNAKDDPFFPGESLPHEQVSLNPQLTADFPDSGGHVGFITGDSPLHAVSWAENRILSFFQEHLDGAL